MVVSYAMFQELPVHQRADAVSSLVYEASARVRDPVYGCVGAISYLQNQVADLQMQLAVAQAEILCIQMKNESLIPPSETDLHQKSYLLQNNFPHLLDFNTSNSVVHCSPNHVTQWNYFWNENCSNVCLFLCLFCVFWRQIFKDQSWL